MKAVYFKLISVILISFLGIIVYSNTFHCSFHLDDVTSIIENPAIKNIHDPQSIWNFWPTRFITYLTIAFNYHFNALNVVNYHVFNLGIHLISAILVWWLVLLTLSTPAMKEEKPRQNSIAGNAEIIALLVALVFVSHPVGTQAVTYIVQRAASMSAMFYLATLCFYVQSRLLGSSGAGRIYFIASLITAILAMFTKETAITLPLMVLLYEFSFLRIKKSLNWAYVAPFLLTMLIMPLTMIMTNSINFQGMHRAIETSPGISSMQYFLTQLRVIPTYIRLAFIPLNQNLDYDYATSRSLFELPVLMGLLFLGLVLYFAKRLFPKYRLISFSIFWFFLTLLPESSVIPIKDVIFEHRLYLPLVGYSMFLVGGAYYLFGKNTIISMILVFTILIGCNSFLTYQRNKVWKDEITLWNDTVDKSPNKARPHYNRGIAYHDLGNVKQAMTDYNKAITVDPKFTEAFINRGNIYNIQGDFRLAMSDYNKAIEIDPKNSTVYNSRGSIYFKLGNFSQAIADFNKAIDLKPDYIEAYNNRASSFVKAGDPTRAITDFEKVIELNPGYADKINSKFAEAYNSLGTHFAQEGNFTQAIDDFNKTIDIYPKYPQAYNNRGIAYENLGNTLQAMSDYNKAISIDPNCAECYNSRGLIYLKQGRSAEAFSDLNKAIKINPRYAEVYLNRGNAYAKQNDFIKAIADYTKAIGINPQFVLAYDNRAILYYQTKEYDKAWGDVKELEGLKATVNPALINALKQATEIGDTQHNLN